MTLERAKLHNLDPEDYPNGSVVTKVGGVWTGSAGGGAGGSYREVLMVSGVSSPPEPLESSDGSDWLYGIPGGA